MKKKILSFFNILLIAIALCSCTALSHDDGKINVVTANFPAYCFAKEICGDNAEVKLLLPLGSESHHYEPTGKDMVKIQKCDLFIYTGSESDAWIDKVLSSIDSEIKTLKMTDCVKLIEVGHSHDHEENEGNHTAEYDEHVWTSPLNAIKISEAISNEMQKIDNENAESYKENTQKYTAELQSLHNDFVSFFDSIENKTMVFGDRFPFVYFAHEYGIEYASAFPGCADHSEPSASTIAGLIEKINSEKISTVYHIEFSNMKIANTLSEATGAKIAQIYTCHNVSKEQFESGEDYISLMRANLDTLKESMI